MKKCDRIEISLYAHDEDETPEESEEKTGSMKGYANAVRDIMEKATGKWGWCIAVVRVRAENNNSIIGEGKAQLGNCSYLSAKDFMTNSGYFKQMTEEATEEALSEGGTK